MRAWAQSTGAVTAYQLFTPYGAVRYSHGTMPTAKGFTGQREDPSGLTYFNARYYDSVVGAFVTADVAQGPNRYGYVGGIPETLTDPTGQGICEPGNCYLGGGGHSGGGSGSGSGHQPPTASPPDPPHVCDGCTFDTYQCGTYTDTQCQAALIAQEHAIEGARRGAAIWQLIAFAVTAAIDFFKLREDLQLTLDVNKVFNVALDIGGFVADLGFLLEGIGNLVASIWGDSGFLEGLRNFGDVLGKIGGAIKAGVNAVRSAAGFLVYAAKWVLFGILTGFGFFTGQVNEAIGLMKSIVVTAVPNIDWFALLQAGEGALQVWAADQATQADDWASETPYGFCTNTPKPAGCL